MGNWLDSLPEGRIDLPGTAPEDPGLMRLALARLPARVHQALRRFSRITGQHAVASLVSAAPGLDDLRDLPVPIHPLCREKLRTVNDPPCADQWQGHLDGILADRGAHSHRCPLGLQCSCIPVYLGSAPVGVVKLVLNQGISREDSSAATATLALAVTRAGHECHMAVLRSMMKTLGGRIDELVRLSQNRNAGAAAVRAPLKGRAVSGRMSLTAVERSIKYLHGHHRNPEVSVSRVAAALGYHPKYLAHLFARTVGTRMGSYLCDLRVSQATRLLLGSDHPIKEIAYSCGFRDAGAMTRVFRRRVGVSPGAYRRLFARPAGGPTP